MRKLLKKREAVDVEEALHTFWDMVYRLALVQMKNPGEAEDVFQDVFLRLVRYKDRIEGQEHLKAWLIRVTVNCCKKQFDSAYRRRTVPMDREIGSEQTYEMELPGDPVYDAVLGLPDDYRNVIHLFYYEQYSVREIAELLGLSETAVKTRLSRARGKLKNTLKGEYGGAGTVQESK